MAALMGNLGLIELINLRQCLDNREPIELERRTLIRIRCLVMIYKTTIRRCKSADKACRDLRTSRDGQPFMGQSAIQYMTRNNGLNGILEVTQALTGQTPTLNAPVDEHPRPQNTKRKREAVA